MNYRRFRLRFRRRLRQGQRQVEGLGSQAEQNLEQHFFTRFDRLMAVRRFVIGWLLLLVLLIGGLVGQNIMLSGYYQTLKPVPGGIYTEGVLGAFRNANPIYATSDADTTVSKLVFASLFTYDTHNRLVGDLASDYNADARGIAYTVHLKPDLRWQDGAPLTSADVAFTYRMIQNPDAQSPLQAGWQGVKIATPNARTVVFTLPNALGAFPHNLTTGIVPEHLLAKVPPAELRSADFNTVHPVGAGPFMWSGIQVVGNDPATAEEQISLRQFKQYRDASPKLHEFIVHVYASQEKLIDAFKSKQLTGVEGLTELPSKLEKQKNVKSHDLQMTAANMVFFKTSEGVLSDKQVRQALVQGTDTMAIIKGLKYPTHAVREPLLVSQLGYDPALKQSGYDLKAAKQQLDSNGWAVGKDGVRHKNNQPLTFALSAADVPEARYVTKQLERQWKQLGVRLQVQLQEPHDFQTTLAYHTYDAILYGISLGADPDVFVYWDSSQADIRSASRLNLSEYKNQAADTALEAGRTRANPAVRAIKYKAFLQAWQQDNPALALYQPRLLYLTHGPVAGLDEQRSINTASDRLNNVANWQIRLAKVTND
jgi:peptide/nickel transport system substrate-binding protein